MADIDLKTATPDTSLPTTGFLFGADSQASASPSVYSTQTVATTLLGSTSLTGATITTSQPVLDLSQTWNAGAVTFTGLRFNAAGSSDANSAAGSLLMDLQVGGSSRFKVNKASQILFGGATGDSAFNEGIYASNWLSLGGTNNSTVVQLRSNIVVLSSSAIFCWANNNSFSSQDLILTRRAAANLRLGAADAAGSAIAISSVASNQLTLASNHGLTTGAAIIITGTAAPSGTSLNTRYYARVIAAAVIELYSTYDQATAASGTTGRISVTTAGTSAFVNLATPFQSFGVQDFTGTDIPGQPFIIRGSRGTGTGPGGDIVFQVAPAGTTGSPQNALATALTIGSDLISTFGGRINSGGSVIVPEANGFYFSSRGGLASSADGVFRFTNTGGTGFGRLIFGTSTSGTPALKPIASGLQVRTYDDTAYNTLDAQLRSQGTAPATTSSTGTAGDIRYDASYIYVCTATDTWKRVAIATW